MSEPLAASDEEVRELIRDLAAIMFEYNGRTDTYRITLPTRLEDHGLGGLVVRARAMTNWRGREAGGDE
jgi:hypothetical protein